MVPDALRRAVGTPDPLRYKRSVIIRIVWKVGELLEVCRPMSPLSRRKAADYRRRNHPISLNEGVTDTCYPLC
jgi:hypothetical protein